MLEMKTNNYNSNNLVLIKFTFDSIFSFYVVTNGGA